jgi:hypothetical protein
MTITPPPGIYEGIRDAEYHQWDALGSTDLKTLATHPAGVFRYRKENPRTGVAAFDVGTAAHALILEGREDAVTVVDAPDWRSKAARDARDAAPGVALLVSEWDAVRRMRDAAMGNPDAAALLTGHTPEVSLRVDADGMRFKGRLDAWHPEKRVIVDLKTTRDASPRGFGRAAAEYGYHAQAAHYHDMTEVLTGHAHDYYIVAVEKDRPHVTAVYEVLHDHLAAGRQVLREALETYRAARDADEWPTRHEQQPLELPSWAYPDMEMTWT